jgi:hypothetical protein
MRARLHARAGKVGFYREGSHDICDAAQTAQLSEAAVAAGIAAIDALATTGVSTASVMISENIAADERALYIELDGAVRDPAASAAAAAAAPGVTGCTVRAMDGTTGRAGIPAVSDPLAALTAGRARTGRLQRRAESFFQANRFLLPSLVTAVIDQVPPDGELLDLYAGVGLFSLSLAATGRRALIAVEGDRTSGADLLLNVGPFADAIAVATTSVEEYLVRHAGGRTPRRQPGDLRLVRSGDDGPRRAAAARRRLRDDVTPCVRPVSQHAARRVARRVRSRQRQTPRIAG